MSERQERKGTITAITQCAGCDKNKGQWGVKAHSVSWFENLRQGHTSYYYYYYYLQRNPSNRSRARNDLILMYCWAYTDIWLTGRAKLAASPLVLKIPSSTFRQKINFLAEQFLKKAGDPSTVMLNNESQQSTFLFLKWPLHSRAPSVSQITNPLSLIIFTM